MSKAGIAASGAAWTILSSLFSRGISMVGTFVLIRYVVPGDYGEASAASVVVSTINQITTLGVGMYAISNRDATREEIFHATFIHVTLGLIAARVLLFLGKPLAPLFDTPNLYRYVPGLACTALIDRITFMPERILIRQLQFRKVSVIRSLGEITYAGVSLGAAILGWGGMSIVFGNLARSTLRAVAMVSSVKLVEWLRVARLKLSVLRKIAGYGLAVSLNGLANFAAGRWDNLLVARFFGPAVMATYNLAYSLAEMPATYVGEQVTDVVQATFAHMEREERKQTLLRAIGALGLVTFPLAIGLGAVAPTLAAAFLDKKWAGAGAMLMVLSMLSVTRPTYGAIWSFIMVEKGPRVLVLVEWLSLGALMAGIATLGRISPLWTCGAVGIVFTLRMLAGMFLARRLSGVSVTSLLLRFLPPLAACVPMAAAVFGLRFVMARLGIHAPVVRLAVEVAGGALVFLGSAFVVAPGPAHELLGMILVRAGRRPAGKPGAAGIASADKAAIDRPPDSAQDPTPPSGL